MKSLKKNTVLLLLIFLSYNTTIGQIQKMIKNDRVAFDTAAVMPVDTYRSVRQKLITADTLIDSLRAENVSLFKQTKKQDSVNYLQSYTILMQQNTISRKDSVNNVIVNNFNALYKEVTKPTQWYEKRGLHIALAVFAGWLLAK